MSKLIGRTGREKFGVELMQRLRPLQGVQRVSIRYLDDDPSTAEQVQREADGASVTVVLGADGIAAEVHGALARFRRDWDFGVDVVRSSSIAIVWDDERRPTRQTIWACGRSVEEALSQLRQSQGWGDIENLVVTDGTAEEKERGYSWSARFTAGGTSMKAAGWHRTGDEWAALYAVTWWK